MHPRGTSNQSTPLLDSQIIDRDPLTVRGSSAWKSASKLYRRKQQRLLGTICALHSTNRQPNCRHGTPTSPFAYLFQLPMYSRKLNIFLLLLFTLLGTSVIPPSASAQSPQGKSFGFGLILGDPLGATVKIWTSPENAFVGDIGADYFGSPRIDGDYLWHFDAFRSRVVKMYAGPGLAVGFGQPRYYFFHNHDEVIVSDSRTAVGARVIFGLNIVPPRTPLEIFLEAGPLISFTPYSYVALDAAIGIRFYP